MAHKKSAGTTKNGRDSNPKYLGVKLTDGDIAQAGSVLIRQRGTDVIAGRGVSMGKDHTLFALISGIVKFGTKRKMHFDNRTVIKKMVSIV
ncbi:MAG: 50S ribosomal protein L27 [Parcubacteria group bacterium GW2011_GWF2_39_8b]|uniref:Large ribosomal subunit protein bL27 n=3 Tax=Candidatus Zambryskiibacteriota TaxID=1817925 RepID=A0A1G2T7F6_9BACT|nr:MAG: 50S ribosomal protein L27 [Parcubacteria group bacterium GW2011_GWF2_39_8b]OHA92719.1 MAG: 50S ribosomal protein L27 [Candidatus Zambryskibacteria bacterium RIFCSPHIGHO2_02_38_10.5]OHA98916.1 MAG: 50S ribosomal protein L27 [Candidatus Zambryskibacteria bacterium RIFCSPHIGHO2_12_FULL_38_37]OHB08501.1 MAG: 50S ribosomal protein L27 [Candidatus Zambryskibacteria bacterium RIFCSPLOWO2_02_39_10]OHB13621.1 MAG: 50S ribosomal protein L27 [Candidatus Zambryskibacteria bacterium RIFCSPLOWO2_12_3